MKNSLPLTFFEESRRTDPDTLEFEQLKLYAKTILLNLLYQIGSRSSISEKFQEGTNRKGSENSKHQWDTFLRLMDTEVLFISLHSGISELRVANQKSIKNEIKKSLWKLKDTLTLEDLNSTRIFYTGYELFMPTVQGIPLVVKWDSTTLLGLNIRSTALRSSDKLRYQDSDVVSVPEFVSETRSFLGYSFVAKVGIKNKINLDLSPILTATFSKEFDNKVTLNIQTTEAEINVIDIKSDTYMFRKLPAREDVMILPNSFEDPRIVVEHSCLPPSIAEGIGIRLCWKFNVSDIRSSEIFPFGNPSYITLYLEFDDINVEKLQLNSIWNRESESTSLAFQLETVGKSKTEKNAEISFNTTSSDNYNSVEVLASGMDDSSKVGLKLAISNTTTKSGTKDSVSLFASSSAKYKSDNKVLSITYESQNENSHKPNIDFRLETQNHLAQIINVNIKVLADVHCKASKLFTEQQQMLQDSLNQFWNEISQNSTYRFLRIPLEKTLAPPLKKALKHIPSSEIFVFPFEITVYNMEVHLGSGDLKTATSLRTMTHEEKSSQYQLMTTLECGQYMGGVKIMGSVAFRGNEGNLAVTSNFSGKIGNSHEYQTNAFLKHDTMIGTTFYINAENLSKRSKLAVVKFSRMSQSSNRRLIFKEEAEMFVVGIVPHYHLQGFVVETQSGAYGLAYDFKIDNNHIAHIEGPISVSMTTDKTEEQANFTITGLESGIYQLVAGYSLSANRSVVAISLSQADREIAVLKVNLRQDEDDTLGIYQMRIPSLIVDFNTQTTLKVLKTNLMLHLLPNSTMERILKGQSFLYYNTKKIHTKLTCEDHQRKSKSIFIETRYDFSPANRIYLIDGDVKFPFGEFFYDLDLNLGIPTDKSTFKHLVLKLTNPAKKHFLTEFLYHNNVFNTNVGDVSGLVRIETLSNVRYQIWSSFCYAFEPATKKVEVAGQVNITCPGIDELIVKVETLSTTSQVENRDVQIKSFAPVFEIEPHSPSFTQKRMSDDILHTEMNFRIKVETLLPSKTVQNATIYFEKNSTRNKIVFESFRNTIPFVSLYSELLNTSEVLVSLLMPTKKIQVTSKILSKEMSLTLYPNKEWSNVDHSIGGRYSKGSKYIYEDKAIRESIQQYKSFNSLDDKVDFLAHVAIPQTTMTGAIELNLNDDHYEKVSFSIESIELSKGSFKIEMIFRSPSFASDPRVLIESSFTSSIKSLTISFQNEAAIPPSLSLSGTYSSITEDQANIYCFIKTSKTEMEITSSLNEKYKYSLPFTPFGVSFNGTIRSSTGLYDFSSAYCSPYYFDVGANERGNDHIYVTKVGSRFPLIGIDRRHANYTPQDCSNDVEFEDEIVMASVSLYNPMILQLRAFYDIPRITEYMNQIKSSYLVSKTLIGELLGNIWEDIFENLLHKDSIKLQTCLKNIYQDIRYKMNQIYNKLKKEFWIANISKWGEKLQFFFNNVLDSYKDLSKQLKKQFIASLNKLANDILISFDQVGNAVKLSLQTMNNHIQGVMHYLQNLLNDLESIESVLRYLRPSNLWKLAANSWAFVYGHFRTELELLESFTNSVHAVIMKQWRHIWDRFISNHGFQNYVSNIMEWTYKNESTSNIFKKIFYLHLGNESGSLNLRVPLRSPAHSVRSALHKIGVPEDLAHDYITIPLANINSWHEIIFRRKYKKFFNK